MITGYSDEEKTSGDVILSSSGERLLGELLALNPKMCLSSERSRLRHRNMVLFDLTLGEMRTAATNGCTICTWLVQNMLKDDELIRHRFRGRAEEDLSLTLAAEVHGQEIQFGIPRIEEKWREEERDAFIHMDTLGIPSCQMIAEKGKLEKLFKESIYHTSSESLY